MGSPQSEVHVTASSCHHHRSSGCHTEEIMPVGGCQLASSPSFRPPVWCHEHCQDEWAFKMFSISLPSLLLLCRPVRLSSLFSIILSPLLYSLKEAELEGGMLNFNLSPISQPSRLQDFTKYLFFWKLLQQINRLFLFSPPKINMLRATWR